MFGRVREVGRSLGLWPGQLMGLLTGLLMGLVPALLVGGCAALYSDAQPPEVSLAGLGFGEPGLSGQQIQVDLRVRNPNNFELGIDWVTFDLEINDKPFAHGRTTDTVDLPALGEAVVPVLVKLSIHDLIDRVQALGSERRLDYRLTGEAQLDSLLFGRVPFQRGGKLALPRIPGLSAPDS